MNSEHKDKLLEKRKTLQLRNQFNEFVNSDIIPFKEVLNVLNHLDLKYDFVSLRYGAPEFQPMFTALFQTEAFSQYNFLKQELLIDDSVMTKLVELYPSNHSSRFFPKLANIEQNEDPKTVLQSVIKEHQLQDTFVYICWVRYPFLMEIFLEELSNKITNDMMDSYHEDIVIFPKDYS